jgi:tRNA modification GTPase
MHVSLPRILVHNKIDLSSRASGRENTQGKEQVFLSAKTGEGLDHLRDAILEAVGAQHEPGETFIARERHVRALRDAQQHLALAARQGEMQPMPIELFAEELRLAQQALASITGEFTADDLLGEIFTRFCIGK